MNIAAAKTVTRWELPTFAWVEILDTEKVKYLYAKRAVAPAGAIVHVDPVPRDPEKGAELRLRLVRKDGMAVLRQDQPGLPHKIVVQYEDQGRLATYEYEQVQSER